MICRQLYDEIHSDYSFEKKLKSGPNGTIYLVRRKNTGERSIYRHFYGSADVYKRLLEVTCENLPRVKEAADEDGRVIVLEEYIQGDGLDFILEGGPLNLGQTRDIAIQVCRALRILHSVGAVHRDVKPENIILRGDKAVLIDFDASRMYKEEQTSDTRVMGTTGYAAPEQYGFSQTDARADIYAVGVLINEMLTNRHPATCLADGVLRPIIEKCIEVNVDKRYSNADELILALENLSEDNIVVSAAKEKRKNLAKRVIAAVLTAAVFASGIFLGNIDDDNSVPVMENDHPISSPQSSESGLTSLQNEVYEPVSDEQQELIPEVDYGKINILRVYRGSENGTVEMSENGNGGFTWTIDESDIENVKINFSYAGTADNREDIMKDLGYTAESENIPITVQLGHPDGYENVMQKIDEGETDMFMRVCSVRNGILEEGTNRFVYEWDDSDGELPTFTQNIALNIDYGDGFDNETPYDTKAFQGKTGTLNVRDVYRESARGNISLQRDIFDYRTVYATGDRGDITNVKVTYTYMGPIGTTEEIKKLLYLSEGESNFITMEILPPKGYNGMNRMDGKVDYFFHVTASSDGRPTEGNSTYTVTWTDSTGSLQDLTQTIKFDVDYGGRISAQSTGYNDFDDDEIVLPKGIGKTRIEEGDGDET